MGLSYHKVREVAYYKLWNKLDTLVLSNLLYRCPRFTNGRKKYEKHISCTLYQTWEIKPVMRTAVN